MAPQRGWSNKDERQYEHIKESAEERGESTERAEEIAARTVNKRRSEEGRTKARKGNGKGASRSSSSSSSSSRSSGGGGQKLADMTKEQLYARARELAIECRSSMSKEELLRAIRSHSN